MKRLTIRSSLRRAAAGAYRRARSTLSPGPRPTILMYHRIAEDSFDPWGLVVTPAHFREQLQWLAKNRIVLPLSEFAAKQRANDLPRDAVAITFDDGYACSAEVAAPMLEHAETPATIFIPAELIERGDPFWWDELQELVLRANADALTLDGRSIRLGPKRGADRQWEPGAPPLTPRQTAFEEIWSMLRQKPPSHLDLAMADLRAQSGRGPARSSVRPMSAAQVRATASARISFGSHALTHPWLTSLSRREKEREIGESADRCEALIGARPAAFAYPYGSFDAESELLVEEAGFDCACTTAGSAITRRSRPYALPRVQVGDWDGEGLGRALARLP